MKPLKWIVLVCLFAGYSTALAEPTPAINYLMDEPASLFDLGLLRLEQRLNDGDVATSIAAIMRQNNNKGLSPQTTQEIKEYKALNFVCSVDYDWGKNRIVVMVDWNIKAASPTEAVALCTYSIRATKKLLGLTTNSIDTPKKQRSFLRLYFSHLAYSKNDEPVNVDTEIEQITNIQALVELGKSGGRVMCQSDLLDNQVYCSESKD